MINLWICIVVTSAIDFCFVLGNVEHAITFVCLWNDRIELVVCSTKVVCSSFGEELSWWWHSPTEKLSFLNIICNHVLTTHWSVPWISHRREFVLAKHCPDDVAYSWIIHWIFGFPQCFYSGITLIQYWSTAPANKLCNATENLLNLSKYFAFVMDFMIESRTPGDSSQNPSLALRLIIHNVCTYAKKLS